ncbi:glycosyl hydrolase [Bosea sp. 117]|uniref:glycoside hydrolase family 26 protein n=1 Tax=Bosea sp. 117 TaxID=1125973 RepID=UPI00068E3B0C|nr:glycosyl hydrolase [Bosea sp. 117]
MTKSLRNRRVAALSGVAAIALIAAVAIPVFAQPTTTAPAATDARPKAAAFGAYDPNGTLGDDPNVRVEHVYIPWLNADLTSLKRADQYAQARDRDLLITIEPWSWVPGTNPSSQKLLAGILAGAYDGTIRDVCTACAGLDSDVTIRWGHEMDLANGRYLWSNWAPADYAKAYRHFVKLCRKYAPSAHFMWSPRGEPSLAAYYPGSDYVDVIGLSVFDLQQYDVDHFGRARTLAENLRPSYDRVTPYGKPIVVAELGYEGDAAFEARWHADMLAVGPEFPGLTAVVYFNEVEPYPWPEPYGRPDWRLQNNLVN